MGKGKGAKGGDGCAYKFSECMVGSTCTCCWGMVLLMFLCLMMSVSTINTQLAADCTNEDGTPCADFPTSDSSGFRDRNDINSLQSDAMAYALMEKKAVEETRNANKPGWTCKTENRKTRCFPDTDMDAQTQASRRWGLTILFKRKDDKNIFEPAILEKIQATMRKVLATKNYENVCLKVADGGFTGSNATSYSCAQPSSPMQWIFPSSHSGTYVVDDPVAAANCTTAVATFSGMPAFTVASLNASIGAKKVGGEVYTGGTPWGNILQVCAKQPNSGVSTKATTTSIFDGKGSALTPCIVDRTNFTMAPYAACKSMFECSLSKTKCNSGHCACSSTSTTGAPQQRVDSALEVMRAAKWPLFMVGKHFKTDLKTNVLRITVKFGGPLRVKMVDGVRVVAADGVKYKNEEDTPEEQTAVFKQWAIDNLKPILDSADFEEFDDVEGLYFLPLITFQEILSVLLHDGLLSIGSIVFVFFYLAFHSQSMFIAMAGMFHVMMSFPFAFLIYRHVFGIIPFYPLCFLSIYVILAIGADDIFVFVDAWRQSALAGPEVNKDLHSRMAYTWARAAKAMAITSLTTFGAFSITAISPLSEVATFGLFTALLVAANYLFVIAYFPVVIIIYHRYFENCKCFICCQKKASPNARTPEPSTYIFCCKKEVPNAKIGAAAAGSPPVPQVQGGAIMPVKPVSAADAKKGHQAALVEVQEPWVQRQFGERIVPLFNDTSAKYVTVVIFSVMALAFIAGVVQLGPTTKEDQLLPEWHKFQRIINMFTHDFGTGQETPMKSNSVMWGYVPDGPMDRSGVGRFDVTDAGMGVPVWDKTFDLAEPLAQKHVAAVCDSVWTAKVAGVALVRQSGGLGAVEVNCFMVGFREWRTKASLAFPTTKAEFVPSLQSYLGERLNMTRRPRNAVKWLPHNDYENMVAIQDGKVKWAAISMNTTIGNWDVVYERIAAAHGAWATWMTNTNKGAPAGANKAFFTSPSTQAEGAWVFMNTQELLVSGAFTGAIMSALFAFLVLSVSTFNPFLSFLALVNILGIVLCILGMMNVLGWELGVIESVSITVLVGLSVDYVVHLANSYIEATDDDGKEIHDRKGRVEAAWKEMGITVFGGAITSLGASAMLFLCYFQQFFKFGGFMFMTIFGSFLWANLFFMPLLSIVGPEGDFGSFKKYVCTEQPEDARP